MTAKAGAGGESSTAGPTSNALPESGIALFDMSIRQIASDQGAMRILSDSSNSASGGSETPSLPPEVLEAIRRRQPGDLSCVTTHVEVGNSRYIFRSYVVFSGADGGSSPMVAVHFESHQHAEDPIGPLSDEYGLTTREREALRGIAHGLTTKELALRMSISPNTAKTFVRLIMIKLGVTSRTAILGKLLEHGEPADTSFRQAFSRPPAPVRSRSSKLSSIEGKRTK
jgi:DNA-binding CsgD family transcriptional regulator